MGGGRGKRRMQQGLMQQLTWLADSSGEEEWKGGSGEGENVEEKMGSWRGAATMRREDRGANQRERKIRMSSSCRI